MVGKSSVGDKGKPEQKTQKEQRPGESRPCLRRVVSIACRAAGWIGRWWRCSWVGSLARVTERLRCGRESVGSRTLHIPICSELPLRMARAIGRGPSHLDRQTYFHSNPSQPHCLAVSLPHCLWRNTRPDPPTFRSPETRTDVASDAPGNETDKSGKKTDDKQAQGVTDAAIKVGSSSSLFIPNPIVPSCVFSLFTPLSSFPFELPATQPDQSLTSIRPLL
jgi:hypothetical protein